jgi:hypothetical protein
MFERHCHDFQKGKGYQSERSTLLSLSPTLCIAVREQVFVSIMYPILFMFVGHGLTDYE